LAAVIRASDAVLSDLILAVEVAAAATAIVGTVDTTLAVLRITVAIPTTIAAVARTGQAILLAVAVAVAAEGCGRARRVFQARTPEVSSAIDVHRVAPIVPQIVQFSGERARIEAQRLSGGIGEGLRIVEDLVDNYVPDLQYDLVLGIGHEHVRVYLAPIDTSVLGRVIVDHQHEVGLGGNDYALRVEQDSSILSQIFHGPEIDIDGCGGGIVQLEPLSHGIGDFGRVLHDLSNDDRAGLGRQGLYLAYFIAAVTRIHVAVVTLLPEILLQNPVSAVDHIPTVGRASHRVFSDSRVADRVSTAVTYGAVFRAEQTTLPGVAYPIAAFGAVTAIVDARLARLPVVTIPVAAARVAVIQACIAGFVEVTLPVAAARVAVVRASVTRFVEVTIPVAAARVAIFRTSVAGLVLAAVTVAAEGCPGLVFLHIEAVVTRARDLSAFVRADVASVGGLLVDNIARIGFRQFPGEAVR